MSVLFLLLIISYNVCSHHGTHINPVTTVKEYPIEKMSLDKAVFDNGEIKHFDSKYVTVKEPDDRYMNTVVETITKYKIHWLFWDINQTLRQYTVYPESDVYEVYRNKDGGWIYQRK